MNFYECYDIDINLIYTLLAIFLAGLIGEVAYFFLSEKAPPRFQGYILIILALLLIALLVGFVEWCSLS